MRKLSIVLLNLILLLPSHLLCTIFGLDTAVSRQAAVTFYTSGNADNEMRGFAAFEQGFILEESATTCTFNSFFPISGTVNMNGGTLGLSRNLIFDSGAQFTSAGIIEGHNYAVELPDKISALNFGGDMTFEDVTLLLNSDITLTTALQFGGTCFLEGREHVLDCGTGIFAVGDGASLLVKDLTIKGIEAGSIFCTDSAGTFSFENVEWILDANYAFTQGKFDVLDMWKITGPYILSYQSTQTSTIKADATIYFDSGMTFSYDAGSSDCLAMEDSTSRLHFYETTFFSTVPGLQLTKGTLFIEGECPGLNDATTQNDGIVFGDGLSASNDVTIKILPESGLDIDSGYFVYKNLN